ncbi:GntR family transcriptional regulator [Haloactinomyces albus]|uniref:DNA-binding GntR family transcriptional regulator n=1 Tax=Haloactinomyces albus TaxID=1352928 RepID=A0AAE4CPE0_9ACTN|nr:GntR family transcriptional regulator [Haloactinomyces albus]MDR7301618.1 DNA-binding GntR family transcriptional regulator [Haloactinomyces albus]
MADRAFQPVTGHQVSAVDLVTVEVRQSILRGTLAPGERFSVAKLARQMNLSHIPVREALRRLEGQGLINLSHARSAVVVPLSVADLEGIYGLRKMIEPELAARAAVLGSAEHCRTLRELIDKFEDDDPETAWQAHQQFHRKLVEPAASAWDLRTLEQLWAAAERYTRLVYDFTAITTSEQSRREHVHITILDAVRAHDSVATRRAVAAHLAENESEMVDRISRLESAPNGEHGQGRTA